MTAARLPEWLRLMAVVFGTVFLSAVGLDRVPAYLHDAEVQFALHARSIAATGYDTNGRFLPLYFQMPAIGEDVWFHPFIVYWTAPLLTVFAFSEATVRFASVIIGAADVILMYLVAARLFKQDRLALLAAALIALTPAHFIHSRLAMDYLHPVPFILGWLWCLAVYEDERRPQYLYVGCFVLGAGVYSYIASVAMMPIYLLATLLYASQRPGFSVRRAAGLVGCFAIPLLPAVVWLAAHPAVVSQTLGRYSSESTSLVGMVLRVRDYFRWDPVQEKLSVYWDFFNPAYLFFAGGSNLMNSTRAAGVFLLALAVLLPVGLYQACVSRPSAMSVTLVAGFLTAPIAATAVGERYAVDRQLGILPFAVLLAVCGCRVLSADPRRPVRWAAIALLVVMPLQFASFYADYMGDYRIRSVGAFEFNIRGAAEELIARADGNSRFYLSRSIPYARTYWRFYLAKSGNDSFDDRTTIVDAEQFDPEAVPRGGLIMARLEDTPFKTLSDAGQLRLVHTVPELGRDPLFVIYER